MRKIVVSEFMTLDGVMQAPGGAEEDTDGGFRHGGWTAPYWHDEIGTFIMEALDDADTLLFGRRTWEIHGGAFEPLADGDPEEPGFNAKQKYVVSTTLTSADAWRNSTLIRDDVVEQIRVLKAQPGKDIWVDGSSRLVHTLARNGLIDEYRLIVYPIVLGSGKKVFEDGLRINLQLVEARPLPSGVVLIRYSAG